MLYPGDHARRGRLDGPQIFPHCFHKIAQIACELFLVNGASLAIGYMETRLGAVKMQFFVRRPCTRHCGKSVDDFAENKSKFYFPRRFVTLVSQRE